MAEVFKAKSYGVEGFEKTVVLKRILPSLAQNPLFVEMFLHEARLSVALSHANIVQVFDLGREEDTYFIAMEYVLGTDLAGVIRRLRRAGQRVPVELAVFIACEVARALDYAHRRKDAHGRLLGIVHRDISPQNVLLSFEGEVKVTDFGIAKARTTVEAEGTVRGKYAYMAPEQADGGAVDSRADLFALGVTLWETLAGQNPHAAPTKEEVLQLVRSADRPPLREVRGDVPEELARLLDAAMSLDPAVAPGHRGADVRRAHRGALHPRAARGLRRPRRPPAGAARRPPVDPLGEPRRPLRRHRPRQRGHRDALPPRVRDPCGAGGPAR